MKSTRKSVSARATGSLLLVYELLGFSISKHVRIHVSTSLSEEHFPLNQDLSTTPPFVELYLQALHEDL